MMRVRLKADGRLVQILADGSEAAAPSGFALPSAGAPVEGGERNDATYARAVRAATNLSQSQFAKRIGVPIETVRNWEQGKRSPRGPARALLKLIETAPDLAFAVLSGPPRR